MLVLLLDTFTCRLTDQRTVSRKNLNPKTDLKQGKNNGYTKVISVLRNEFPFLDFLTNFLETSTITVKRAPWDISKYHIYER